MTANTEVKTIELWDGYEVEVDLSLMDDFDFASELADASSSRNIGTITQMYMAMVGGDDTYDEVRAHLTKKDGRVTVTGITEILEKINSTLPKSGNRVQRRSGKISA
jgi:hypothetical protein